MPQQWRAQQRTGPKVQHLLIVPAAPCHCEPPCRFCAPGLGAWACVCGVVCSNECVFGLSLPGALVAAPTARLALGLRRHACAALLLGYFPWCSCTTAHAWQHLPFTQPVPASVSYHLLLPWPLRPDSLLPPLLLRAACSA